MVPDKQRFPPGFLCGTSQIDHETRIGVFPQRADIDSIAHTRSSHRTPTTKRPNVTGAGWLKEEMSAVQTSDLERRFRMINSPGKSFFGEVAVPGAVRRRD